MRRRCELDGDGDPRHTSQRRERGDSDPHAPGEPRVEDGEAAWIAVEKQRDERVWARNSPQRQEGPGIVVGLGVE